VHAGLDDLVIALYVTIDELLEPRRGPGRPPRLSDAELVCLAVAQVLLGYDSERRWLRAVQGRLGHLFPYVCGQAAYNRRLRRAAPLVAAILHALAVARPGLVSGGCWTPPRSPVGKAARPASVRRWPAGPATAMTAATAAGTGAQAVCAGQPGRGAGGLVPGQPHPGGARVAEGLLDHAARQHILRPGMVILGDKGFAGQVFEQVVAELEARLVRPDRADEPARFGDLGGVRQWIEAIFDTLKDQLGLERHGAHTIQGLWIRVAQRLLALAAGVWFNWQLGAPVKRSLVAYDH
jgi:hypothetical protein